MMLMTIDAPSILQVITLGVAGWVLLEVVGIKEKIAALSQKLKDLPCETCNESDCRESRTQKKSNQKESETIALCET